MTFLDRILRRLNKTLRPTWTTSTTGFSEFSKTKTTYHFNKGPFTPSPELEAEINKIMKSFNETMDKVFKEVEKTTKK